MNIDEIYFRCVLLNKNVLEIRIVEVWEIEWTYIWDEFGVNRIESYLELDFVKRYSCIINFKKC